MHSGIYGPKSVFCEFCPPLTLAFHTAKRAGIYPPLSLFHPPFIPLSSPLYPSLITPLSLLDSLYGMTRETMTRVALKITILIMAKVVSTSSQQEYLGTISSSLRIELISPLHLSPPRFHIRCLRIRGSLRSMLPTIPHWYVRTYDTSAILLAYCQEYFFLFSS